MKIRINRAKGEALTELLKGPLPQYAVSFHVQKSMSSLVGSKLVDLLPNSWDIPTYYITSLGRKALRCTGTDVEFDTVNPNCPPSIGKDTVIPEIPEPKKKKVFSKYLGTQGSTVAFHKLFGEK